MKNLKHLLYSQNPIDDTLHTKYVL